MRGVVCLAMIGAFASWCATSNADDIPIAGRVIDADGKPVQNATVSDSWRANGSGAKPDGTLLDLTDEQQLAEFWGNLGDMQPFPARRSVTKDDGSFEVRVHSRSRVLFAMDSTRNLGGVSEIPDPYDGKSVEIRLRPVVTVRGRVNSVVGAKTVDWSHVYVSSPLDSKRPLSINHIISCGSFDGRFEFRLPPGTYSLEAYAISEPNSDDIDLSVRPSPSFTIDDTRHEFDLGILELTHAPPDREDLETLAKDQGRWRDYTKHYGEAAPNWHAVDARGIGKETTIKTFRGKWLLIDFWGPSCASCLADGVPRMMDLYMRHLDKRDQFEIVGICIDFSGDINSMEALDARMAPIIAHVWKGRKIEFPIVLDNTFQTWERYGIPGLGTVVLVDPNGNLVEGDEATLQRILQRSAEQSHLPEPAAGPVTSGEPSPPAQ